MVDTGSITDKAHAFSLTFLIALNENISEHRVGNNAAFTNQPGRLMKKLLLYNLLFSILFVSGFTTPAISQKDFVYNTFQEAWLAPAGFDAYVAEHKAEFNLDYLTCSGQLIAYFQAVASEDVSQDILIGEPFALLPTDYLEYLSAHPGAGVANFLRDIQRVGYEEVAWLDTPSGQMACELQGALRQSVFIYKQTHYLQEEATFGKDLADKELNQYWYEVMSPLFGYLEKMRPFFNCNYY